MLPDLSLEQYEQYNPTMGVRVGSHTLVYAVPNRTCAWRVQSLMTKEPATIEWLNSLPSGAAMLDVGANVGMYSIYAAVVRSARVFAFEPEAQNYATLCRNIVANKVHHLVLAWSAAVSDEEKFDCLHLSQLAAGGSCHSFGEARDAYLREASFPFLQGSYSTTIDRLVSTGAIPPPEFIKIDVDGFEHKVVAGAAAALRNTALQSVIVEINPTIDAHRWIIRHLEAHGFRYDSEQVARSARTEGPFVGVGEYVFRR